MYKSGDIIAGDYAVSHVYTNGGMGVVYKVRRLGWDVDMAMKCPRPELFENADQRNGFVKECETWMDLGAHPNIISCYYIKTIDAVPAVLMEYADGGSLLDYISSGRLYDGKPKEVLRRILDYAIQTARGLLYAHQKGYVHQDVKPANVLLTGLGIAKVSDFGLSRAKRLLSNGKMELSGRSMVVSSGGWTPAYGSPEQALGLPLTRRTDVWSWAVMVLEMIHGSVFWKAGPFAARALRKLWPWQIFSPRVQSSRGLLTLLRECLDEHEEKRPEGFDIVVDKLLFLYKELCEEEYPRLLPPSMLMAESTLCNRIASYAELEGGGKDYFDEVYNCISELRSLSPWSVWGELNYAVYLHAHGVTIERIHRAIENLLRRANTDQEKEWLLNLLLAFGLTSVNDPKFRLLQITDNERLIGRIKSSHESLRSHLNEVFRNEKMRKPVTDEFDIDKVVCGESVSENATARVRVERSSTEHGCSVTVAVEVGENHYKATDGYLPEDARIEYVTTDDKAIKVSLWVWVPLRGFYQKVFGLKNGELVSYVCDFRKKEDWGVDAWDVPHAVYISGDARITMLRYKTGVCSVWLNERGDAGDGRNICVIRLSDFGLIPPETILPKLRLESGFEYGISDGTAYRLMKMLARVYGKVRIPCYISRPESSEAEFQRSKDCAILLSQAAKACELGDKVLLNAAVRRCLEYGILPNEKLLYARHQMLLGAEDVVLRRCWHSSLVDEYWDNAISAIFSYEPSVYHLASYGMRPRQLVSADRGLGMKLFPWEVDPQLLRSELKEPSFIVLCGSENGDIIIASCDGWYVKKIYRVRNDRNLGQVVVWECQIPGSTIRSRLLDARQTKHTIGFQLSDDGFACVDKISGQIRVVKVSGPVRFWSDWFSHESNMSEIILSDSQLVMLGKNGEELQVVDSVWKACSCGRLCGISHDGRRALICSEQKVSVCDMITGCLREIYVIDPFSLNQYGLGGARVMLCAISPNGRAIAVVTADRRMKVFDAVNRIEVFEWKLEGGSFGTMQFDASGRWLTVVQDEKKLEVFQLFWEPDKSIAQLVPRHAPTN